MPQTNLKKLLGDGGAGYDLSHGSDVLYKVLKDMAQEKRELVSAYQAAVATGILTGGVASCVRPDGTKYNKKPVMLSVGLDVCGTAGQTTVQFRVNGVSQGSVTIDNADPDPSVKTAALTVLLADGDRYDINVSAAPTGGTGLRVTVWEACGPVDVE